MSKAWERWTAREDAILLQEGQSLGCMADRTGRTVAAVKGRRAYLASAGFKVPTAMHARHSAGDTIKPHDAPMGAPRPCARCRKEFQPTVRRRMLCAHCWHNGPDHPMAA